MITKPLLLPLTIFLLLAIIVLLQLKSCRRDPVVKPIDIQQLQQRTADSVRQLQASADSLIIRRKDHVIDSLAPLAAQAHAAMSEQGKKVAGTITSVKQAKASHDTVTQLAKCDSLVSQVEFATMLVNNYATLSDSLTAALQVQRRIQDSLVRIYQAQRDIMHRALDSSEAYNHRLADENIRLDRQAHKRWSVGPGGGMMITGAGQLVPAAGISIHYTLFKF